MNYSLVRTALATAALLAVSWPAFAQTSVTERLRAVETRVKSLEVENRQLKSKLKTSKSNSAFSGSPSWASRTRIGGYGELHYNNLDGEGGASDKNEIDFHRFVLFFGHTFNERTRFFSELELEHSLAGDGKNGEVELEQAYVEYDLNADHRAKAGLFLIPVGIINETHEPPVFYGVERNPVENAIIPATWWAGGAALSGQFGEGTYSYDLAVHEGLATTAANSFKPRNGRQKTSEARASDAAITARLKWTGIPGVELGGTIQHQTDITQGLDSTAGGAELYELHAIVSKGMFGFKGLYAQWNLDGSGPAAIGADEQYGWYLEPSVKLSEQWGAFVRFNEWDNKANGSGSKKKQTNVGVSWWPHPDVVLKVDYQQQDNDDSKEQKGVNIGVGYHF